MRYNPALDGIRALAVFAVILFHSHSPYLTGGFIGVDIFFVLSGYLITRLLLLEHTATGALNIRRFYIRRFLRLSPPLLFLVTAFIIVGPTVWPEREISSFFYEALLSISYISDYSQAFWDTPTLLIHSWSLSIEEHFYIIWPFTLLLILRSNSKLSISNYLVIFYLVATFWRIYSIYDSQSWSEVYFRFDTRMSGLFLGAALACRTLHQTVCGPKTANILGFLSLGALVLSAIMWNAGSHWFLIYGVTFVEISTVGLLISVIGSDTAIKGFFSYPQLTYFGKLSYGLYLWHYPAMLYLLKAYTWHEALIYGSGFALVMAAISYHTIEHAVSKMKARLRYETIQDPVSPNPG